MNIANYFALCITSIALLTSCSDPESVQRKDLDPAWNITVDFSRDNVNAMGHVLDSGNEVRLTNGDALRLSWGSRLWQLYRVNAAFLYTREFPVPDDTNMFEARFDRAEPLFTPVVYQVVLPDVQSALLVEESMTLTETATLNLSWDLGPSPLSVSDQSVKAQLLDCEPAVNEAPGRVSSVNNDARSITLTLDDLPKPQLAGSRICRYSIQLVINTFVNKPESLSLETRSRLFETSIQFTSNP